MRKKIVLACDKFKGSLTANEACLAIEKGLNYFSTQFDCVIHPMADGGEGTLDILQKYTNFRIIKTKASGPLGRTVSSKYGKQGNIAYIETALVCGLQLLQKEEFNPSKTSTFGVGQLIEHAIQNGCKTIHLFIGGSATNDGGTGMATALGFQFLDDADKSFNPTGGTLKNINSIITTQKTQLLSKIKFHVWVDVFVPLFGESGSSKMFASQKGANCEDIETLETGMKKLYNLFIEKIDTSNHSSLKMAGAGGGLAAGCIAFLNAKMGSGIDFITDRTKLEHKILEADLVITGEGSLDDQSTTGKVVSGISKLCIKHKKPLIITCGKSTISAENLKKLNPKYVFEIKTKDMTLSDAMCSASIRLVEIGKNITENYLL